MKITSPLGGLIVPLEQVPDPVFAQKMIGDGVAIDPIDKLLCAPIDGTVTQIHPAAHALTITDASGLQVLMHIGIDTVKLKGEGFKLRVKNGQSVERGQVLIEFDADLIAQRVPSLLVLLVLPGEGVKYEGPTSGSVRAGGELGSAVAPLAAPAVNQTPRARTSAESALVNILLPTGLHARPAAVLASMAKSYRAEVQAVKGSKQANAKSLVALLGLEISFGDQIRFRAQGDDAQLAVRELVDLMEEFREGSSHPAARQASTTVKSPREGVLAGVSISTGLAVGRVRQIQARHWSLTERSSRSVSEEGQRLERALAKAESDLKELVLSVREKTDAARAAIFTAHAELLHDPELLEDTRNGLARGETAEYSWHRASEAQADQLAALGNELLASRANDLRDVAGRVLTVLTGVPAVMAPALDSGTILIAENLTPSETVQLDRSKIVGFCTTGGGATSHVAILARSLGLPALAGVDKRVLRVKDGEEVLLDADHGELILAPDEELKSKARIAQRDQEERRVAAMARSGQPALTRDGHHIEVVANIGGVADAREAVKLGADGVGLLRSEFLFLDRATAPTEDEQLAVYQEIADLFAGKTLVVRTLDVGGDKPLKYLPLPPEENPFLGVRGVRVGLRYPEILRAQIRALLRVKSSAKLQVMFPMISTLEEWRDARAIFEQERVKLGAPAVPVGIMVEVPSVAIMAEVFARECDFMSIGTNDLTQYTLAMDRGHGELASQVDALHPSVLQLIARTAEAGRKHGKWVGVCGGLASDLPAIPILIGLGVTELSVSLPSIPLVKSRVRESALSEARQLAAATLDCDTAAAVRTLEKQSNSQTNPWQGYANVPDENVVLVPTENR